MKFKSSIPIILAVNSVRVAAPSSKSRPLTNPNLKSFMSYDEIFWLDLSSKFSRA
jgi:hypothetical protein